MNANDRSPQLLTSQIAVAANREQAPLTCLKSRACSLRVIGERDDANLWFPLLADSRNCQVGRAVKDRTRLHTPAPQNGNFLGTGQRLSTKILSFEAI